MFPQKIEDLLTLRSTMRYYKASGGGVLTPVVSLETDAEEVSSGFMYGMSLCPATTGYGVVVDWRMSACEFEYGAVRASEIAVVIWRGQVG